jgi:hypothetical protein
MGGLGTFRKPQLKILARSVARCVGLLPERETIATLLIGSGAGNLTVREAVQGLAEGVSEALGQDPALTVRTLRIVERYLDRALEILDTLKELDFSSTRGIALDVAGELVDQGGEISPEFGCSLLLASLTDAAEGAGGQVLDDLLASLPHETVRTRVREKLVTLRSQCAGGEQRTRLQRLAMGLRLRGPNDDAGQQNLSSRVAFWADGEDVHAAAITSTVTVTERTMGARLPLVRSAIERLTDPPDEQASNLAATLSRMLVHADIRGVLTRSDSLVVEVDRSLSGVPWEMLPSTESDSEYRPLGVAQPVARQLRTAYSPRLEELGARQELRILVVGDPGDPAMGYSLQHARDEAVEVAKLLRSHGLTVTLLVGAPEDGTEAGPLYDHHIPPAAYFDVVQHLLAGEFDIVHYCGHADFDPAAPTRAGWVFKGGLLTATELEGMERPPALVVANACLTSQVWKIDPDAKPERPQADEFFRRGVCDYIGTAWPVPSIPALQFANILYTALLRPGTALGEAVRMARESLFTGRSKFPEYASAWAAYQHYGDPTRPFDWGQREAEPAKNGRGRGRSARKDT